MEKTSGWSETLIFLGAGATAVLGMPQTQAQALFFRELAEMEGEKRKPQDEILQEFAEKDRQTMKDFLCLLGNDKKFDDDWLEITDGELQAAKRIFEWCREDSVLKTRILELRRGYDWQALKRIIGICPYNEKDDNLIRDVYSLLDKKMVARQSVKVRAATGDKDEIIIDNSRLKGAYSCAICFTVILFSNAWYKLTKGEKTADFRKYVAFTETLARLMQKEGAALAHSYKPNRREFYQFSYSFVSFNFETVFMWLLFNAHKKLNGEGFYLPSAQKMKLWLDFGFMAKGRAIPGGDDVGNFAYSYDESVAFRQNRCKAPGSPIGRMGKFYFAHGCANWRECPVCGRMMYVFGDEWTLYAKQLNPPLPIPLFENGNFKRTENENVWNEKHLQSDALECVSCGAKTFAHSAPMIMQTLIKGVPTSFLEEVQRDLRVSLEKARHIVLLGYSLPPDDAIWVQTFTEVVRCRKGTEDAAYCSVVVGYLGERRWLYGDEMMDYVEKYRYTKDAVSYGASAIVNAVSIFGKEYVRAWCGGIPQVFGDGDESAVKEILFPDHFVNWKGTRLE